MSWDFYDDRYEQKNRVKRELERRRKRGESLVQLAATNGSRKLATTFWGKAWCDHLESHSDYEYRLPRGRSYLRQGNVYNLAIEPGVVTAEVAGSSLYDVRVTIKPLAPNAWKSIRKDCAGQVGSLLDLLSGKLGDGVLKTIADPVRGLFPKPKEIQLSCTCPDWADMCKHVAAVLYGVGVRLDTAPDLFFVLRSVDPTDLLSTTAQETLEQAQTADSALAGENLSALFGIDLTVPEPIPANGKARTAGRSRSPANGRGKKTGKKPGKPKDSKKTPAPKPVKKRRVQKKASPLARKRRA